MEVDVTSEQDKEVIVEIGPVVEIPDEKPAKKKVVKKFFFDGKYWNRDHLTDEDLEYLRSFPEEQLGFKI